MEQVTLKTRVQSDLVASRKNGDKVRTETLKMMLAQIQYGESSAQPITDLESVRRYRKSLQKAIDVVSTQELKNEIQIVEQYLATDSQELTKAIDLVRSLRKEDSNKGSLMKELKVHPEFSSDVKLAAIDEVLKTPY